MAKWQVEPDRASIHGVFSRDLAPILTIDPGDSVQFRTLDAGWCIEERKDAIPGNRPAKVSPLDAVTDAGHCLCGPLFIKGAKPGMALKVEIQEVVLGTWGWTSAGGWPHRIHQRLGSDQGEEAFLLWKLDRATGLATNQHGRQIKMRPFMGVMGMPSNVAGYQSTIPPRRTGGNIDCKELVAGTTLYLPIEVEGGLFSVGDGHAVQGDGEVGITAIECPMERVVLKFDLVENCNWASPRAETDSTYITLGFHEDLHEAAMQALAEMLSWMGELYGLPLKEAQALASLLVDLRVTQLANQTLGIHAVLNKAALS